MFRSNYTSRSSTSSLLVHQYVILSPATTALKSLVSNQRYMVTQIAKTIHSMTIRVQVLYPVVSNLWTDDPKVSLEEDSGTKIHLSRLRESSV